MKLVYISNSIIPSRTANSIQVMKMCEAFARNGHEVILVVPHRLRSYEKSAKNVFEFYGAEEIFQIRRLWWPSLKARSNISGFLCGVEVLKIRPDIVYGRYLYGLWWSLLFGYKVIYELHAPVGSRRTLERWFFDHLVRSENLQHVVVISEALHNIVRETVKGKRVIVAHDGADMLYGNACECLSSVADRHFGAEDNLKIGYVGHLYPGRGVDIITKLACRVPGAQFYLIGGTSRDVEKWRGKVSLKNLHFLGFVPPGEITRYYEEFDLLLMPFQRAVSVYGGRGDTSKWMSPLKMFEYMAAGKAIIASDLPVLREVLGHEHNALMVSPDDPEQWETALLRLIGDSGLRERLGSQARKDLEEKYSWRKRATRVLGRWMDKNAI